MREHIPTFAAWLYNAALEHEAILTLVGLAFIISMPPSLPGIFARSETLSWCWSWMRTGLVTLISLQHPSPRETKITETRSVSVETPTPITSEPAATPQKEEKP